MQRVLFTPFAKLFHFNLRFKRFLVARRVVINVLTLGAEEFDQIIL